MSTDKLFIEEIGMGSKTVPWNSIALSGLSHKSFDINKREKFSLQPELYPAALKQVLNLPSVNEAVVVSTCNRVEVITASTEESVLNGDSVGAIEDVFEQLSGVPRNSFSNDLYHLRGGDALSHLFEVACGLDSMVLGESQILGQLKNAYDIAHSEGATKVLLNRAFHRAFGVAKSVRTNTSIGENAVSVCYAAKELGEHVFGDLKDAQVMVLGAGEMGALALKHFRSAGCKRFFVVNKTLERALHLAEALGGVPLSLDNYKEFLPEADIIIGAITLPSGTRPILTQEDVSNAFSSKPGSTKLLVDFGVPRNFDSTIAELPDAFLYNIDDLEETVSKNLESRALEVDQAKGIVEEEVNKFGEWLLKRSLEPAIREVMAHCSSFTDTEIVKTMKRLKKHDLSSEQLKVVELAITDLSQSLISKALHQPITTVKKQSSQDHSMFEVFKTLFLKK